MDSKSVLNGNVVSSCWFHLKPLVPAVLLAQLATFSSSALAIDANLSQTPIAGDNLKPAVDQPDINKEFQKRLDQKQEEEETNPFLEDDLDSTDPHISIASFAFRTLPEYPELGITEDTVLDLVENLRQRYMKVEETLDSGFTQKELEELGAFLQHKAVTKTPDQLNMNDLNQLLRIIRRQNALRGMTYSDIESVAYEVTKLYRDKGLLLTKAYIPPQEVKNGVVELDIIVGKLGQIEVEGNKKYDSEQLAEAFSDQIGEAVDNARVEESMYMLNDYPGLNVYGFFEKGENLGESKLNLQVRDEKFWELSLRADNHGTELTGKNRLYAKGSWFNPTGIGDQLTLGVLQTYSPENSDLYQVTYSLPLFRADTRLELFAEKNQFKITSEEDETINRLNLGGTSETYSATVMHQWKRSRELNFSTGLKLSNKKVDRTSINQTGLSQGDHAEAVELIFQGDVLGTRFKTLNMAYLSLQYGQFRREVPEDRGEDFYRLALETNSLFFVPLPFTDSEPRLILKSKWRYGSTGLPSFEQMNISGANTVRAFSAGEYSVDNGVYLGAELYFDVPESLDMELWDGSRLSETLQYALFVDGAYGNENFYKQTETDTNRSDTWAHLAGAGFLFRVNWRDTVSSTLTLATPISSKSHNDLVGDKAKDWQTYIDLTVKLD